MSQILTRIDSENCGTWKDPNCYLCTEYIERTPDPATVMFHFCDVNGLGSIGLGGLIALLTSVDTDSDGLPDINEPAHGTDPTNPDTDNDGLNDGDEVLIHGTNPLNPDTDGGGVTDGDEVSADTDPLDPADDICVSHEGSVIENLGDNVSYRVSTNPATGVSMLNLGDNVQYYDWSNCPNTIDVSNLGDNITYKLKEV